MSRDEYEKIQNDLSHLLKKPEYKNMTSRERQSYKDAVLACKSMVSNYNPERR